MTDQSNSLIADAHGDGHPQARRHVRNLLGKTLAYFSERGAANVKLVAQHLQELLDGGPEPVQAQNFRSACTLLQQNADAFNIAFQASFKESLDKEEHLAVPELLISDGAKYPEHDHLKGVSLSLIDMKEVERILLLDRVVLRFTEFYEAGLNPLTERMAVLLGLKVPSLARNPFRPEVFVRSFLAAAQKSGLDEDVTQYLLLSLEPMHCIDLVPLYADLNSTLMHAGIKALGRRLIRKADADLIASAGRATALPNPTPYGRRGLPASASAVARESRDGSSVPAAWQAVDFLRQLGFGSQGFAANAGDSNGGVNTGMTDLDSGVSFSPAQTALIAYLGQLQVGAGTTFSSQELEGLDPRERNVLRQMREFDEVRGAPELDRGTVDALAEVFDFVFSEQDLAQQMRLVMGRLQIPVLKAAMLDRQFFLSSDQPARRLIDTLASAALSWEPDQGETDPVYLRVEKTIQRVLTEFKDDVTLFGELVGEVSEFLFETEQQAQVQIAPLAEQEQRSEVFEQALLYAGDVIEATIKALPLDLPLVAVLGTFLRNQWREVMARAWVNAQHSPQQWEQALTVMQQLIWSTQPKTRTEERVQLVSVLPDLVRELNSGLDAIGWTGEERATFTRALMATHAMAIRKTRVDAADTGSAALAAHDSRHAARVIEQRVAAVQPAGTDEFDARVQAFTRGMWFDFRSDNSKRQRYCLSWLSPLRTRMVFTQRDGGAPMLRSAREVAALLRQGQLRAIVQKPIVSRALERIMGTPGAPGN